MPSAGAIAILGKCHVQDPMQTVLDSPMTANPLCQPFGLGQQAADEIAYFRLFLVAFRVGPRDAANPLDIFPLLLVAKRRWHRQRLAAPESFPAMPFIRR